MKLVSVCFIIFAIFFAAALPVFAQEQYNFREESQGQIDAALLKVVPVRFLPLHPLYFSIRTKEFLTRFFQPSASKKAAFDLQLSGKRLKEAYLLADLGDLMDTSNSLNRYAKQLDRMVGQLEKARSQTQPVDSLVDAMAEGLRAQETLLYATYKQSFSSNKKSLSMEASEGFDRSFKDAVEAHVRAVMAIDNVKTGVKDRFSTPFFGQEASGGAKPEPSPTPAGTTLFESTPGTRPRRIIY